MDGRTLARFPFLIPFWALSNGFLRVARHTPKAFSVVPDGSVNAARQGGDLLLRMPFLASVRDAHFEATIAGPCRNHIYVMFPVKVTSPQHSAIPKHLATRRGLIPRTQHVFCGRIRQLSTQAWSRQP